jgi:hypothetical protein
MPQHEFRVTVDHLSTRVVLSITHPDGTLEVEGMGSDLTEALYNLAEEYDFFATDKEKRAHEHY